jgi:hypothetical protein
LEREEAVGRYRLVEVGPESGFAVAGREQAQTFDSSAAEAYGGNHPVGRRCQNAAAPAVDVADAAVVVARMWGIWIGGFLEHKACLSTAIDGLPRDVSKGKERTALPRTGWNMGRKTMSSHRAMCI